MYSQKKKFCENEQLNEVLRCFLEGNHNHWYGTMGDFSEELLSFTDEWETSDDPSVVHSMDDSLKNNGIYVK